MRPEKEPKLENVSNLPFLMEKASGHQQTQMGQSSHLGKSGYSLHQVDSSLSVYIHSTNRDDLYGPNCQHALTWTTLGFPKESSPPSLRIGAPALNHTTSPNLTPCGQELRGDTTKGFKHGPSGMDHLKLGDAWRKVSRLAESPASQPLVPEKSP